MKEKQLVILCFPRARALLAVNHTALWCVYVCSNNESGAFKSSAHIPAELPPEHLEARFPILGLSSDSFPLFGETQKLLFPFLEIRFENFIKRGTP